MKKNKMMRLASCLLVAVLLTTCAVSGTFAKYVTSGSATDSARVAKFGVTVTGTGDMFKTEYAKDDDTFTLAENSVVSTDKVVAPGTSGSLGGFAITGTPEVAVRVSYTADTVDFGDKWVDADGGYYCPIEITVGTTVIKGLDYTTIDAFETAIKDAINATTKDYAAGTDLSTVDAADKLAISWAWNFEGEGESPKQTDVKDTYLGDQAANNNAATINMGVSCTVTQID